MSVRNKILETLKKIITSAKKLLTLNIGTLIFGALFIYMLITVLLYVTSTHVTSYQVTAGPLAKNQTYTALALRTEEVVTADSPGYVTYYAREGSKVRKAGTIYSVGDTKAQSADMELKEADLEKIRSQLAKFANNFSSDTFHDVYSLKYEIEGTILQSAGIGASGEDTDSVSATFGTQTIYNAPYDGVVLYSTDGYESLTPDTVSEDSFSQMSYQQNHLLSDSQVKAGEPVYKLVTDENWTLMIPLTDKQAAELADRTAIKVKFLKDGATQVGGFSIVEKKDGKYGQIDLSNGMVRYASDRFLDIELVTNTKTGLKIPMSSVVSKEFYLIPEEFKTQGNNQQEAGFLVRREGKGGKTTTEFISTTLYELKDGSYYVETSDFKKGDVIVKQDSSQNYVIGETAELEGVYSMNKGYAVFRKISVLDQNDEYCIVDKDTSYGIAQFDHIVLNGSSVKEEDILY
ncbi:HlyD family efflux transporter periplasmic adaptor subunit [Lactonifactor longoviformis]|uniref:HlyD family efflux transporter periplasmic adaptor subunit n=1 Tax=Lactonifactor longoviformis TaxID=341220 RepID=UPI001D02BE5F|nr:HlyD family efflux transporter periplasmic adaptor subunit [Lactonifactor longoviformis]MCB5714076.1 hypothetical protein [Lactonifactor longoviformis]MCB5718099.1 hypothetical protein [Lactonifactor longoviformis]